MPPTHSTLLVLVLLASVVAVGACSDGDPSTSTGVAPSSGAGGIAAGGGSGVGGAAGGAGTPNPQGGQAPVYVGLTPNPQTIDGAAPSTSDVLLAELTVFAAGVGTISLDVPFADLNTLEVSQIVQRVSAYAERGLSVMLTMNVVEGRVAHRPASTKGLAWDHPQMVAALQLLLASVLDDSNPAVSVVVLGRRVDTYIEAHPDERRALTALFASATTWLIDRDPALLTGVGLQFDREPEGAFLELVELGNAVTLSYLPGLGESPFPPDTNAAKDLDAMMALADAPEENDGRPVVLQAVGYPSSANLGASPDGQEQLLASFFAALEPRRAHFSHVNVQQLHDLDEGSCALLLDAQGRELDDPWGDYMCSTGLRDSAEEPKAAWARFLEAAASMAPP